MKQIAIILLLLFLLISPMVAVAQDDECEGVRCESNATAPLCEAAVLPILFVAIVKARR